MPVRSTHVLICCVLGTASWILLNQNTATVKIEEINALDFCPLTTALDAHIPTVILRGSQNEERTRNRTFWTDKSDDFLPYDWPPAHRALDENGTEHPIRFSDDFEEVWGGVEAEESIEGGGRRLCNSHRIPSSPPPKNPEGWSDSKVMFGMATPPSRAVRHLALWEHWMPTSTISPPSADNESPLLLVLTPPYVGAEERHAKEVVAEAITRKLNVHIRELKAERFETRYLALAQEMWLTAMQREEETGVVVDWFIFMDDDTFFPDWNTVVHMLTNHDSTTPVMIGALSEAPEQVKEFGRIAFGGAGIYLSRALFERMNRPGVWNKCLEDFGSTFGGDAMISYCAASVVEHSTTMQETLDALDTLLEKDQTLHQLDLRGDATGFFQSGFLITSLHHFLSWFTIFPPWTISGAGDLRNTILIIARAAAAIGGDNFGRRYVFDGGKTVVHLGYSVVSYPKKITRQQLSKTEHTWVELKSSHPLREPMEELVDKLTYYITETVTISPGIIKLMHSNRDGGRLDIIFDGRGEKASTSSTRWNTGDWIQYPFSIENRSVRASKRS